ncbi:hypothetical protein [Massilia sp. TWR1-2-2]|uniref:hypothetical protein n=1 Tax=Massilia sp. TWR1-2-2 TaxID=2804584 RepID=UPI003CF57238
MTMTAIGLIGLGSAGVYLWRRRWIDALLVLVAAAVMAGIGGDFSLPHTAAKATLTGDGLTEAQWRDLPARPLAWTAPTSPVLRLDFPRRLTLGRMFTFTIHRDKPGAARLQLLAENKQVIAEASGSAASLSVQWLPPAAELLALRARLLDAAGKTLAEGPVPLNVVDAAPLRVQGRFAAPSFDLRVLNELLANSGALLDWQVTLGKTVTRNETAREPMAAPNLLIIDAAWFERASESARATLLAQGTPLVILGANAFEPRIWQRALQLDLKPQADGRVAGALAMPVAPFNPVAGTWTAGDGTFWTRGRIAWVGVGDWHRLAISQPRQLGMWWQGVLDAAGVKVQQEVAWEEPREMAFAGQRLELCAQGVNGDAVFPSLQQKVSWQRRLDKADASCVAVWPRQAGWLKMEGKGGETYVFDGADWPQWQAAQRRDATTRYLARTAAPAATGSTPLPAWPFALLFTLAMLALWWRERGRRSA